MIYNRSQQSLELNAVYTDLLSGVLFIFVIVSMVFALLASDSPEPLGISLIDEGRTHVLNLLATELRAAGFHAEAEPALHLVRVRDVDLFPYRNYGLTTLSEDRIRALGTVLVTFSHRILPHFTYTTSESEVQLTYRHCELTVSQAVMADGATDRVGIHRTALLRAKLFELQPAFADLHDAIYGRFFVIEYGGTILPQQASQPNYPDVTTIVNITLVPGD